jgi:hypothetical protein
MCTMLGIPTATMASLYTPANIKTVPQQATTSLEDLKVKFKEQELNIAELKAAQALTNDRIGCMEKGVREDIQKLTNIITSGVRTQHRPYTQAYSENPNNQLQFYQPRPQTFYQTRPQKTNQPHPQTIYQPRPCQTFQQHPQQNHQQQKQNFQQQTMRPTTPSITAGLGFIDNKLTQNACTTNQIPMEQKQTPSQRDDPNQQQQFPYFSNPNTYEIPQLEAFEMGGSEDTA